MVEEHCVRGEAKLEDEVDFTEERMLAGVAKRRVRIPPVESLRIPEEGSSSQGKSGPKPRLKSVSDGQQVEIPVLSLNV